MASCKKKNDEQIPTVSISTPSAMTTFTYLDYIVIKGTASDETSLKSIKVELFDNDLIATGIFNSKTATSNNFTFSTSLYLEDIHLTSGAYYIKTTATDQSGNTASNWLQINYTEEALALQDIFLVSKSSTSNYSLSRVDGSSTSFVKSFNGDFKDAISNSWDQLLTFTGGTNYLITYEPLIDEVKWEKSPVYTIKPFFNRLHQSLENHNVYVSTATPSIIRYDKSGNIKNTIHLSNSYYPSQLFHQEDLLFVEREFVNGNRSLAVYYEQSGALKHTKDWSSDIVKICRKSDDELYIMSTNGATSELLVYTVSANAVNQFLTIPSGAITDAVSISDNEVIFTHSNGVYRYTYNNNSLIPIVTGITPSSITYDRLNDRLLVATGTNLEFYSRFGSLLGTVTHSQSIEKVILYYNK